MYLAANKSFTSYFAAIAAAKAVGGNVVQEDNGAVRWSPAPVRAAKSKTRHFMVVKGREVEISKVRQ